VDKEKRVRILVVHPSTTETMTNAIAKAARECASPGTEIVPLTARYGASGIDVNFENLLSAMAVMDMVPSHAGPFDALILAVPRGTGAGGAAAAGQGSAGVH
jgi:allantoin racemase